MIQHPFPPSIEDPLTGLVGIPFAPGGRSREGLDCWGLHRLALQQGAGIEVPSYSDRYTDTGESAANARLIAEHLDGDWVPVPGGEERRLDAVLMRMGSRHPSHIGTVIRPGRMLHTYSGGAVRVEHYRTSLFRECIVGFYRHQRLA